MSLTTQGAATPPPDDAVRRTFASVTSMMQFDELEIRGVMRSIIAPTERDNCFILTYWRTAAHVMSLSKLNGFQHFQAITMIARSLFELSVDLKLIDKIPHGVEKMIAFVDVEKLRAAQKIVKFKQKHPKSNIDDSLYRSYIASEQIRIEGTKAKLWPGASRIDGFANMNLANRSILAGPDYEEIYEVAQPRMSWQVHSGLTGIANLKAETFTYIAGVGMTSCIEFYELILNAMIDEFQIDKADEKIKKKLAVSKLLPWADDPAQAQQLYNEAVGELRTREDILSRTRELNERQPC
jgi:hypothetical protein